MKREAGGTAALFMALYLVFQNGQGHQVASSLHTSSFTPAEEAKKESAEAKAEDAKFSQIEGPWIATRSFLGLRAPGKGQVSGARKLTDVKNPLQDPAPIRELLGVVDENVHAVVATVADPAHTRLQLFFDQQIQALQRAAAAQDWEFAGQWLPPTFSIGPLSGGLKARLEAGALVDEQESQPGVLIFRRRLDKDFSNEVLFVFLVPETPTSGVSALPFHVAMNMARAVLAKDKKVGLLGPSFSGSFESLSRLVRQWKEKNLIHQHVFGGSVSSEKYAAAFKSKTGMKFSSGIASSSQFDKALQATLTTYGQKCEKVAILKEAETAFGESAKAEQETKLSCKIPVFTFPREIAHLRNTYQETLAAAGNKSKSAVPSIDFTLKDPSHGEDGVPVLSSTHTPIGQSAVLYSITNEFRRRGTRLVYVVSTNVLDTIFLARLIHSEAPDVRVLVSDADLLFLPAGVRDSLVGTLFLSTYPMFLQGEAWLSNNSGLFPSEAAQGLFNVTQMLLQDMQVGSKDGLSLASYRPLDIADKSANKDLRPGVWLLMLTRSGLAPLNWYSPKDASSMMLGVSEPILDLPSIDATAIPSPSWKTVSRLTFGLSFVVLIVLVVASGMDLKSPRVCWQANLKTMQRGQFLALAGAVLSVSALLWVLGLPALGVKEWSVFADAVVMMAVASLILALYCCAKAFNPPPKDHPASNSDKLSRDSVLFYLAPAALFYLGLTIAWWKACYDSENHIGAALFRVRSLYLLSNSSASLPFVGLCTVYIVFFVWLFWRFSQHYNPHPLVYFPVGRNGPRLSQLEDGYHNAVAFLSAPLLQNDKSAHALRVLIATVPACIFWFLLRDSLSAFEIAAYNYTLPVAVSILVLLLSATCFDLCMFWVGLRQLLRGLSTDSMQEAVEKVTKHWSKRSVLTLGAASPQMDAQLQMKERMDCSGSDSSFETTVAVRMQECLGQDTWEMDEEFCALQFCRFLMYAVGQAQRMTWVVSLCFVMLALTLNSYSPRGPVLIGQVIFVAFVIIGGIVVWVLSGMERDITLSRMTRSEAGALGWEFWLRLAGLGVVPFISVLAGLFPGLAGFLGSWVAPGLDVALR